MLIPKEHYEELLAEYSFHAGAIALLREHRPYLEQIPSMRRPDESVITIPLPNVRVRQAIARSDSHLYATAGEMIPLPCDVAVLMCDPEWKIKTGAEILIFIHRPQEDFSDLLRRWRQSQMVMSHGYEWQMPRRHEHILSDGADEVYPLFVVSRNTPQRIYKGLDGAELPYVRKDTNYSLTSTEVSADDERETEDSPQDV